MMLAAELDFDHERFRSIALLAVKGPQIIALQTGGDARQPHGLAATRARYDSGLSATKEYFGMRRGHNASPTLGGSITDLSVTDECRWRGGDGNHHDACSAQSAGQYCSHSRRSNVSLAN